MDDDIGDADLERQRRAEFIQRARRENDKRSAELQQDMARRSVLSGPEPEWWNHRCRFDGSLEPEAEPAPPAWKRVILDQIEKSRRFLLEDVLPDVITTIVDRHIADERVRYTKTLGEYLAEQREADRADLQKTRDELRDVKVEIAKLTSMLATLREERASERGKVDLPSIRSVN